MNHKLKILLLFAVVSTTFFSGCTSVQSKSSGEVVFESKSNGAGNEIYITNADVKAEDQPVSAALKPGEQSEKRLLSDRSEIEAVTDGFGNRIETRHFPGHPRLRFLILRTGVDGKQAVTVYGQAGDTKIVPNLADKALTAPADEIADAAGLSAGVGPGAANNFMKGKRTESKTPLQPLPSSEFQKPAGQLDQPVENAPPETNDNGDASVDRQNDPEEDED